MAKRASAIAMALLLGAACTPTVTPGPAPFDASQYPAIRLQVGSIERANASRMPTEMGFIARQRSERLVQEAQAFLRTRLVAVGGTDFARATVEEASLVERPRPTGTGYVARATEPDWEMVGVLALKVAVIDGLGIELAFATSRVEIRRTISQRASVEAKENFARTIINDLLAASSRELETSIDQNLADRKAG